MCDENTPDPGQLPLVERLMDKATHDEGGSAFCEACQWPMTVEAVKDVPLTFHARCERCGAAGTFELHTDGTTPRRPAEPFPELVGLPPLLCERCGHHTEVRPVLGHAERAHVICRVCGDGTIMSRTDVASRRAMINRRAMLKRLEENTKSDQIPDAKSSLSVLRGMPSIVNSVYVRKDELADMIMDMELPICKAVMITPEAVIFTVMAQSSTKKHTHIPKRIARNLHFRGPIPQSGDWLDLSQLNPDQILKSFQIQSVTYVLDGVTVEVIVTIDVQEFYDTISSV